MVRRHPLLAQEVQYQPKIGIPKTQFCVLSRRILDFFCKMSFFRLLSEKIQKFDRKKLGIVIKTAFYMFRGTFWGKD